MFNNPINTFRTETSKNLPQYQIHTADTAGRRLHDLYRCGGHPAACPAGRARPRAEHQPQQPHNTITAGHTTDAWQT
eukprot:4670805-Pleurochrysis_carterae.AAC.6